MDIKRNGKQYGKIEVSSINNHGVECKIYFCSLESRSIEKQTIDTHNSIILDVLGRLIQRYGGFPITSALTKEVYYLFDNGLGVTASIGSDETGILYLTFNDSVYKTSDAIRNVLVHELYHIINEVHYKQQEIYVLIEQWNKRLRKSVEANKKELQVDVEDLVNYIQSNSDVYLEGEAYSKINGFYKRAAQHFWNYVMDTSLGIIAIELDDKQYIDHMAESDKVRITEFESQTETLNRFKEIVNLKNPLKKKFYLSLLEILQFMTCFTQMPIFSIAWGVLSQSKKWKSTHPYYQLKDDATPSELIEAFKLSVKSKCSKETSTYFLDFYESYLDIVKAGAIHNNPLNPDIEKQIFDTECLKLASKSFKLLNKNFNRLLVELRLHQEN